MGPTSKGRGRRGVEEGNGSGKVGRGWEERRRESR